MYSVTIRHFCGGCASFYSQEDLRATHHFILPTSFVKTFSPSHTVGISTPNKGHDNTLTHGFPRTPGQQRSSYDFTHFFFFPLCFYLLDLSTRRSSCVDAGTSRANLSPPGGCCPRCHLSSPPCRLSMSDKLPGLARRYS